MGCLIHSLTVLLNINLSCIVVVIFCYIPKPRTYIRVSEYSERRQMARQGFFLPPMPRRVSNPLQSVELYRTGTYEGRSIG